MSMITLPGVAARHKAFTTGQLERFISHVSQIEALEGVDQLSIFATGAYGRFEANPNSGIDLFFLTPGKNQGRAYRATEILVNAGLINIVKALNMSSFCDEGGFIKIFDVTENLEKLGTNHDVVDHGLELRMLYLLESTPIYDPGLYETMGKKIINAYLEDYKGCSSDFPQAFLVNDILRYWKATSLEFEHSRSFQLTNNQWLPWLYLENLKRLFYKKMACYTFILQVISDYRGLDTDGIFKIVKTAPLDRLLALEQQHSDLARPVDELVNLYTWYLSLFEKEEEELLAFIRDPGKRDEAFEKARSLFSQKIVELISLCTQGNPLIMKHLLV